MLIIWGLCKHRKTIIVYVRISCSKLPCTTKIGRVFVYWPSIQNKKKQQKLKASYSESFEGKVMFIKFLRENTQFPLHLHTFLVAELNVCTFAFHKSKPHKILMVYFHCFFFLNCNLSARQPRK